MDSDGVVGLNLEDLHDHNHAGHAGHNHSHADGHDCIHDSVQRHWTEDVGCEFGGDTPCNDGSSPLHHAETHRKLVASAAWEPFRITIDDSRLDSDEGFVCMGRADNGVEMVTNERGQQHQCTPDDILTDEKRDYLKTVLVPAVRAYYLNLLKVRRVVGDLPITGMGCGAAAYSCCTSQTTPANFPGTDYVLQVTARPTTGNTLAWAIACMDDSNSRPYMGQANFGPSRITVPPTSPTATCGTGCMAFHTAYQTGVARHEVAHALGFSGGYFSRFRHRDGVTPRGLENIRTSTYSATLQKDVTKIITPAVVGAMRRQFDCNSLTGLEIEDGGGGGTGGSHWEKRVMYNDFMTGSATSPMVYSEMSLALFEDSGWYTPDYTQLQQLPYGYKKGCGFVDDRCSERDEAYFCRTEGAVGCSADHLAKGYCTRTKFTASLPSEFQYFGADPMTGGTDSLMDYCPMVSPYSNGNCQNLGATATNVRGGGQQLSESSRCFVKLSGAAGCWDIECTGSGAAQVLRVRFGVSECVTSPSSCRVCPPDGGTVTSPFGEAIACPPTEEMCRSLTSMQTCPRTFAAGNNEGMMCSDAGSCRSGDCICNPGRRSGNLSACEETLCPGWDGADFVTATGGVTGPKPVSRLCGNNSVSAGEGVHQGQCNFNTGLCQCHANFTGAQCDEKVCPRSQTARNFGLECSGHGVCDRVGGTCTCEEALGFSGDHCQNSPGFCNSNTTFCGSHGTCERTTGTCVCADGYFGVDCSSTAAPAIDALASSTVVDGQQAPYGGYAYFSVPVHSSFYDFSVVAEMPAGAMVDMYAIFKPNAEGAPAQYVNALNYKSITGGVGERFKAGTCVRAVRACCVHGERLLLGALCVLDGVTRC
jgi:hypothetical protein